MIDDRAKTAYHESGHAVAAAALGGSVIDADIIPALNRNGICHYHAPALVVAQVAIILSGDLAVWEHAWRRGVRYRQNSAGDFEHIRELQRRWYHGKPPENIDDCEIFQEGEALALEIVSGFWGAIESVAAWLLQRETIRGEHVHAVVSRHKAHANIFKPELTNGH